ncbi:hypothetical protein [Streptomyces niveus]|uniref:hypothetical protein n=1 Tax=Streptomyces niveus TaxID=193462 RepID=UPI001495AE72|nr:hypothetical protein [Streptomyces niveus]
MTHVEWQWRERSSGAPYRQRVSMSEAPAPDEEFLALIEHELNCTACKVRTDGAFCPTAAELVRAEREARR